MEEAQKIIGILIQNKKKKLPGKDSKCKGKYKHLKNQKTRTGAWLHGMSEGIVRHARSQAN